MFESIMFSITETQKLPSWFISTIYQYNYIIYSTITDYLEIHELG